MTARRGAHIEGVVQGVGFRPFVARLAAELDVGGRVYNASGAVELEIEGAGEALDAFARRLVAELPRAARVDTIRWRDLPPLGERELRIDPSVGSTPGLAIPPDLATCDACVAEVLDPAARRHDYPFTNCTRCGPRFTIAERAPYDRERTSMAAFAMCADCAREYGDTGDRRFHAQPIACPRCGPALRLVSRDGSLVSSRERALADAAEALFRGDIVALKGLGGYQLLVRADREDAVVRLRRRKHRPSQPFALLVADLDAARALARVDDDEARALRHVAAPIVLLERRAGAVAASVAPRERRLGIMLPATPLHVLLTRRVPFAVVCTSGNVHDEPICIEDADALERLGALADVFLTHDRAILRRADDSVVHVVGGRMRALRTARGLSPVSLPLDGARAPVLALGAHIKQAPVLAVEGRAIVWPHVGDLSTPLARAAMVRAIDDLEELVGARAELVATDLHPDYATTIWAADSGRRTVGVQHHHAHVAAVLAEHRRDAALGFAWDGVGLGADGTAWGGETLAVTRAGVRRVGHMRPFVLPGGDRAARDGRRALVGLCASAGMSSLPACLPACLAGTDTDLETDADTTAWFRLAASSARLSPRTTSVGRLFDATASLVGLVHRSSFEGEAAAALEAVAEEDAAPYPFTLDHGVLDWRPLLAAMIAERGEPVRVASRFHATLVAMIVETAMAERATVVALGGGCFQNALLLRGAGDALAERGIEILMPERVSPGDGGLALGQAWVASGQETGTCA